jgi:hypothetical protein
MISVRISLHFTYNTVELDLNHAKLVKLNIIQQLPSRKLLDPGPPMTKSSFTATEMASPCNWAPWPPGRFDRSSANSEKPLAVSQFDQRKVAGV